MAIAKKLQLSIVKYILFVYNNLIFLKGIHAWEYISASTHKQGTIKTAMSKAQK